MRAYAREELVEGLEEGSAVGKGCAGGGAGLELEAVEVLVALDGVVDDVDEDVELFSGL